MQAVIFDFDGVIVDSESYHFDAICEALKPHEVPLAFPEYREGYTGGDDRRTIIRICEAYAIRYDDTQLDHWCARKAVSYSALASRGLPSRPGAVALVEGVAAELPFALATGSRRSDIEAVLGAMDGGRLHGRFPVIVTADDVSHPKPHPETYDKAARQLGCDPARCIAIEDTPTGIHAAKNAGLTVVGVTGTHRADKLHVADHIVEDLQDLSVNRLKEIYQANV